MCRLLELHPNFKLAVHFARLLSEFLLSFLQHLLLPGQNLASVRVERASKPVPDLSDVPLVPKRLQPMMHNMWQMQVCVSVPLNGQSRNTLKT